MNPPNPKLVTATVLFFIAVFIIISCPLSSAHILDSARIQDWKDTGNNLEIKFSYSPEKKLLMLLRNWNLA
jgi:hypothetical protein